MGTPDTEEDRLWHVCHCMKLLTDELEEEERSIDHEYIRDVMQKAGSRSRLPAVRRPEFVRGTMHYWQRQALGAMQQSPNGILADEMGLGKTLSVLAYIVWYKLATAPRDRRTILLIVPSHLMTHWRNQMEWHLSLFSRGLKVLWMHPGIQGGKALWDVDLIDLYKLDLLVAPESAIIAEHNAIFNPELKNDSATMDKIHGRFIDPRGRGFIIFYDANRIWER